MGSGQQPQVLGLLTTQVLPSNVVALFFTCSSVCMTELYVVRKRGQRQVLKLQATQVELTCSDAFWLRLQKCTSIDLGCYSS